MFHKDEIQGRYSATFSFIHSNHRSPFTVKDQVQKEQFGCSVLCNALLRFKSNREPLVTTKCRVAGDVLTFL